MKVAILMLAAGRGTRFGGAVPKAYLRLRGIPLLQHGAMRLLRALTDLHRCELVLVVHPEDRNDHLAACLPAITTLDPRVPVQCVDGGTTRQESMTRGLAACSIDADFVLVHDAARPFAPIAASRACVAAAAAHGAAVVAVPAADTLKRAKNGLIAATLDRTDVWSAQTPQVVRRDLLQRAMAHAAATGFSGTDDVSLVEHLGADVAIVPGEPSNLKITHPEDLPLAEAILAAQLA